MSKAFLLLATIATISLTAASAPNARESALAASTDSIFSSRRHVAPGAEAARNDAVMQAICREVLVDVDEGYGVSSRESRFICEESR